MNFKATRASSYIYIIVILNILSTLGPAESRGGGGGGGGGSRGGASGGSRGGASGGGSRSSAGHTSSTSRSSGSHPSNTHSSSSSSHPQPKSASSNPSARHNHSPDGSIHKTLDFAHNIPNMKHHGAKPNNKLSYMALPFATGTGFYAISDSKPFITSTNITTVNVSNSSSTTLELATTFAPNTTTIIPTIASNPINSTTATQFEVTSLAPTATAPPSTITIQSSVIHTGSNVTTSETSSVQTSSPTSVVEKNQDHDVTAYITMPRRPTLPYKDHPATQNHSAATTLTKTIIQPRKSSSSIHPLLIYSIRSEIRSFDLTYLNPKSISSLSSQAQYSVIETPQQVTSSKLSKTLISGLKNTIGLDFYYSERESYIFWTDVIEERIYKGLLINGTILNPEVIIQSGLATAEGLAVDWIGQNIYWVESTLDHIEVARLNGTSRRTLIAGDMESPRAIAVDPRYGLMFWTDWDKKSPRIECASMTGEDRRTLINIKELNGGWPNGLTLDYEQLKVYWIDADSDSIHAIDYNGNNHQPLLENIKSLGHPFSITLFEDHLYWTDWKTNSVSMANKNSTSEAREIQRSSNRLFDIKVFHPSRQPQIENNFNPCTNNGDCSHLCLLTKDHKVQCSCPNLMKLDIDDKTCIPYEHVLLIGRTNEIRAVDINDTYRNVMAPISVPKVFNPRQFEYDAATKTIFWVDSQTNEVKKTQLAGGNIQTIIDIVIESPSGLALDWISGNIYVTSASQHKSTGKVFVANMNGEYISVLMDNSQNIVSPKSIAVHPLLGLLFCVDENENSDPVIFSATMDGKRKHIVASKFNDPKLENPSNLAIDYKTNRVYWINQGINSTIQYYDISLDVTQTIYDDNTPSHIKINPSIIAVDGDYLYVSGRIQKEVIIKMHKNDPRDFSELGTQSLDQLLALRVYNPDSQVGKNACSQSNGNCSQLCIPTDETHRNCRCTIGYHINPTNETECLGRDQFLIFSYNLGMKGIGLESSSSEDYYLPPIHKAFRASSIDYVHKDNLIYWVDNEEGSITRINRDTTNYQVVVQGLESEEIIAIDWVAGNIYWIDPYYDLIEVARLNGSNRYVIISDDMEKANGIAVNPLKGYFVWSSVGSYPKIEIAQLDGSSRRLLVGANLTHIDDLAIDYSDDFIYWVDSTRSSIERIREDGTGRELVYSINSSSLNQFVSIAIYKDYLYIADSIQNHGQILRCNKNNASDKRVIQQNLGDGIRDLAIFAEQPIPSVEENPCAANNGGCQELCIFSGHPGQRHCICSHGKLKSDGQTCMPYDTFILFSKSTQIDTLHIRDGESFNNSPYPPLAMESRGNIISVTVDYNTQRVIYSELFREQICSIYFNGTDKRVLVEKQGKVEGIAFINNQLYWTSLSDYSISRMNTTALGKTDKACKPNSNCKTNAIEKIVKLSIEDKPRGIAVDACTSYIYWANWNTHASIQRAGPQNGYKVESIIKTNIKVPNGIAIDQKQRRLYWCDARLDKIETCEMDGSKRIVLTAAAPQHPFALAVWENYVFWTDWHSRGVFRADKFTGQRTMQVKKLIAKPMGIAVAAPEEPSECPVDLCRNPCPSGLYCDQHTGQCHPRQIIKTDDGLLPAPKCKHHGSKATCETINYHDIIMDFGNRYNLSNIYIRNLLTAVTGREEPKRSQPSTTMILDSTTEVSGANNNSTEAIITNINNYPSPKVWNADSSQTNFTNTPSPTAQQSSTTSWTTKRPQATSEINSTPHVATNATTLINNSTTSTLSYVSTTPVTTIIANSEWLRPSNSPTSSGPIYSTPESATTSTTSSSKPTTQSPSETTKSSSIPQPTSECNANHMRCESTIDRLVCISIDLRCDGTADCPNGEDEIGCITQTHSSALNSKEVSAYDINWKGLLPATGVVLIVVVAVAIFLFHPNSRSRRRWFVGSNGAFGHRRMFDDNGTNIEISNPMFDEDDTANLVHCAFSIDLNERTTNFSNPLYERQVLLMNDKQAASNK